VTPTPTGGITSTPTPVATSPSPITLNAVGKVVNGKRKVDLSWAPAPGTGRVEIYRNATLVRKTVNDGFYKGAVPAAGEWAFRVCLAGTSTCSNTAIVVFP
jgi:hypothetical protein